jgi:hypothetical protein
VPLQGGETHLRQRVLLEQDRFSVERPQPVNLIDRCVRRYQQDSRQRSVRRMDFDREQARPGQIAVALHAAGERDQTGRLPFDLRRRNVRAAALTAGDQPLAFQRAQGTAQGEAVDTQRLTQLALGRQSIAGGELTGFDPRRQRLGDLEVKGPASGHRPAQRRQLQICQALARPRMGVAGCSNGQLVYTN